MLSSIHHRPLPLLILCSLLLAPILLLAGCSTRNERESLKDTVLDDYSYAIYNFRCEIRRPLTKEAVSPYKEGKVPLTLEEVMSRLKYTADHSIDDEYLLYHPMRLNYLKERLEKLRAAPNIAEVYPDVDKAVDDLLSTIEFRFFVNSYGEILRIFFVLFYRTLECLSILFCTAHSTFLVVENVEYAPPEVHEVPKTVADSF